MSDFDFDRAAAAMFGGTAPTAAPAPARPTQLTTEETLAERLFDTDKFARQAKPAQRDDRPMSELSEAEQAERLYGNADPTLTHRDAVHAIINAGQEDYLHTPDVAREIAAEWAETFAQHQLNATESAQLAAIGASVMRNPPTPELMSQWTETALQELKTTYGVQGAGQALQDARAYIASVPGAADMLDSMSLGSHPRIVALAAARGRSLRTAGKLKG